MNEILQSRRKQFFLVVFSFLNLILFGTNLYANKDPEPKNKTEVRGRKTKEIVVAPTLSFDMTNVKGADGVNINTKSGSKEYEIIEIFNIDEGLNNFITVEIELFSKSILKETLLASHQNYIIKLPFMDINFDEFYDNSIEVGFKGKQSIKSLIIHNFKMNSELITENLSDKIKSFYI